MVMTKSQFDSKLAKAKKRNEGIEYRRRLREERMKYWPKFVLPSTSKIVLIVAALLCVEILFFCQYMIVMTGDTNALYAMVGTIATLASVVLGYFVKSTKENTSGGVVYESAMADKKAAAKEMSESTEAVG
nr:MAG TPA: hypothetical protein [Bacteriophage sp.]